FLLQPLVSAFLNILLFASLWCYRRQWVRIMCKTKVAHLRLLRMADMPFKLIPEMTDCSRYRPRCRVPQWANRISFNIFLNTPQYVDVFHRPCTRLYVVQHLFHPACSFAARRTLSAALVAVKTGEVPRVTHDTLVLVINDKSSGA